MRFLHACEKNGVALIRIAMDDGTERWMETSKAVLNFARKVLKGNNKETGYKGDEVKVTYTQENGKYNCTRIEKIGETSVKNKQQPKYTCETCGVALKDNKYKKCYNCNKKSQTKETISSDKDLINRQNANHATSRTLIALQGHVDPNNVLDLIDIIHAKYMEKING